MPASACEAVLLGWNLGGRSIRFHTSAGELEL
jgi:hypothetical protein